jgi:hypothetical protein
MSESTRKPYSPLERFPEHVKAIGMITIELGILEVMFTKLLSAILRTDEATGAIILMSTKSTRARLDIVLHTAKYLLAPEEFEAVKDVIKRGGKSLNKRNEFIHETWGISPGTDHVMRIPSPYGDPRQIKLAELTGEVEHLRHLSDQVSILAASLRSRPHYRVNISHKFVPKTAK